MHKIKKYFNPKQIEVNAISAKDTYIVASRGFGKSEGIDAPLLLRNVQAMPRSTGAILSPTYKKLLANTLPAVCHALERLGFRRNVHYVLGSKPDKKLNFKKPFYEPFDYEHCMSWYNGTIVNLISFDRAMSANSMNLDWIMGFEAKYLSWEKIVTEVVNAKRGNEDKFGDCPWHHSWTFTTDMPTQKSGQWIHDKEKLMDKELIQGIKDTIREINKYKRIVDKTPYHIRKIRELEDDLRLFRSNALLYAEYDIFDNYPLISEKTIREWKRDLTPLLFQTSVLNRRIVRIANGFYPSYNEEVHCYEVRSSDYLDTIKYDFSIANKPDCRHDSDLEKDLPLCIAFDYNAAINSLCTGQKIKHEARTQNSLWVKTPKKLRELAQDWCDYYQHYPTRKVIYFFDSTSIWETASSSTSYKDDVVDVLNHNGWEVIEVYMGQQPRHDWKHKELDKAFKGEPSHLFPSFNPHNNEYLLMAIQRTGIRVGRNGFEKDKRGEATDDTPDNPDELKTHITDAWDQLYIGMNYYYPEINSAMPSGTKWT
jgi:hypothetical protein